MLHCSATMKTSILVVLVYFTVLSSSDKVQKLNTILKNIDWFLLQQEFPPIKSAHIIQVLPTGERIRTNVANLFFDGMRNNIYVTRENFHEKLPPFFLLVNIIYACKLKHIIDSHKFIYDVYENEKYRLRINFKKDKHWKEFSSYIFLFKRMQRSLKYVLDLNDPEFGEIEMKKVDRVDYAIDNFIQLIKDRELHNLGRQLNLEQIYGRLEKFIYEHMSPFPDWNPLPLQIFEARANYLDDSGNYRETIHKKIRFAKDKINDVMISCVAVVYALGFIFDDFEEMIIIDERGVLSLCDKRLKLHFIVRNIKWGVLLKEFPPLANSNIIQVLSNEQRIETNINDLFFDDTVDEMFVTRENFHEKLPLFFLLMNIIYACKLKHIIDGYNFISEIYEISNEHWMEFSNYHFLFKRMLNSLNYVYDFKDPKFSEIEMNRNSSVFDTLRYFFLTTEIRSYYDRRERGKLTELHGDLTNFIKLHITPFPDPNSKPIQIQEADLYYHNPNFSMLQKIEFAKGQVDALMDSCVAISEAFGFIIDDNEQVSLVGEF